jgi:rRNA-processing protein FCF1
MKTAFIDTSAINYCYEKGLNGKEFYRILHGTGHLPLIGIHTTYELSRCFVSASLDKAKGVFNIIKDLSPIFTCRNGQLYEKEINKLINNIHVDPFIDNFLLKEMNKRIEDYSNAANHGKPKAMVSSPR